MTILHLKPFSLHSYLSKAMMQNAREKINQYYALLNDMHIAETCRDDRLLADISREVFKRELMHLDTWLCLRQDIGNSKSEFSFDQALVLLPSNAIAAHIVRRVMPFLLMGIVTDVGFPASVTIQAKKMLFEITSQLELNQYLRYREGCSEEKLRKFTNLNRSIVCCTGRIETIKTIEQIYSGNFVACSGRCAILISDREDIIQKVAKILCQHRYKNSCTRLRYVGLLSKSSDTIKVAAVSKNVCHLRYTVFNQAHFVKKIKPSVILVCVNDPSEYVLNFSGYPLIQCDESGVTENLLGFAADPSFGWPGDYLL